MILTQSPFSPLMSLPTSHRRHPSAPPAVVVQPTKVPGILSISKPFRPSSRQQQSHPRQHRSPKPKSAAAKAQPHPSYLPEDSLKQSSKQADALPSFPTPDGRPTHSPVTPASDKGARGRQSKTPKDKATTRNSSHPHGRRNNARQPSPLAPTSQAEAASFIPSQSSVHSKPSTANPFDPFLSSSDSDSENSRPPLMSLTSAQTNAPSVGHPSGRLARRRRNPTPRPATTPTPVSRSIPVPRSSSDRKHQTLSHSAPTNTSAPSRQDRRSSAVFSTQFPVCDDTTDVDQNSPPSTPLRPTSTWNGFAIDGPRTAPLSRSRDTPFGVAINTPSLPRRHTRTSSEGVFTLSLEEDTFHSDSSEEAKKLFGLAPKRFGSVGSSMSRVGKDKSGFFASSIFQNSPSPDELPPPAF